MTFIKAYRSFRPDFRRRGRAGLWLALMAVLGATTLPAMARDAAFLEPNANTTAAVSGDAIKVEPKSEIDIGDAPLGIARRTTLFFTNATPAPVQVEKMAVNGDSNVTAEISNDDCSKQGTLAPAARCSVDVVTTPTSPGAWNVETLMTHNGSGRLARVRISGKTAGSASADKKDSGLFLSSKEIKPVDFGDVNVGEGKTVRSALMVNDSPAPITIYAIDVIEADNGLTRLDQGCAVDMELKAGESCPVTLVWTPTAKGKISTDLIIRHSGQLGFAVIPVRGTAHGEDNGNPSGASSASAKDTGKKESAGSIPPPPSQEALDAAAQKVAAVASASLQPATPKGGYHLIGTVGNRALLFQPDGSTAVAQSGDELEAGGVKLKIIAVASKSVDVVTGGKKQTLALEAVSDLTDKAKAARQASAASAPALGGAVSGLGGMAASANAPAGVPPVQGAQGAR